MAECVVDALEVIDIDDSQRECRLLLLGARNGLLQLGGKTASVECAGQRVARCIFIHIGGTRQCLGCFFHCCSTVISFILREIVSASRLCQASLLGLAGLGSFLLLFYNRRWFTLNRSRPESGFL